MTEPVTIQAFDESSGCRANCTIPRCGDGILDGARSATTATPATATPALVIARAGAEK